MTEFEAAVHELLGVIAEALGPVVASDRESGERLAVVQLRVDVLVHDLVVDQMFPDLSEAPARDVRRTAAAIRHPLLERPGRAA